MLNTLCGFGLYFSLTGFQLMFAILASLAWLGVFLFSLEYMKADKHLYRYYIFMFLTYLATIGVFLSADFMTTFIFFELMSLTSYMLVIQKESRKTMEAGQVYLAAAIVGGMVMLMGLFMLHSTLGTLNFEEFSDLIASLKDKTSLYLSGLLIFIGFAIKAGIVPLHMWLPTTYTAAPAPTTALLSSILSKTGIFGILVLSCRIFYADVTWGNMLLSFGLLTMFSGAVFALMSVDLKRTLAYSSISQIGFITVGIGMLCLLGDEGAMASGGTILYMMNHSLVKWMLFLGAGAIYINLRTLNLNDIKGYGRKKPLLGVLFAVGALNLTGLPWTSGYIAKTFVHESMVEYIAHGMQLGQNMMMYRAAEWIFLLSGGITLAYMLKIFICIFIEKNTDGKVQSGYDTQSSIPLHPLSLVAIAFPLTLLLIMGIVPSLSMDIIGNYAQGFLGHYEAESTFHYYTLANLLGPLISGSIGLAIYGFAVQRVFKKNDEKGNLTYNDPWPENRSTIRLLYRPLFSFILWLLKKACSFLASIQVHNRYIRQIEPHEERFTPMDWIKSHPLSDKWRSARESVLEVSESMSFGLLAAVIGLCAVLLYLL